jgi:hypothetical protein
LSPGLCGQSEPGRGDQRESAHHGCQFYRNTFTEVPALGAGASAWATFQQILELG